MLLEIIYAVLAGLSDLFGGWLAYNTKISRIMPRYIIGFASGLLISLTFVGILPELNIGTQGTIILAGFIAFYILEKILMLHSCGENECKTHKMGSLTVFGMALDNIVDGAGIAIGFLADPLLGLMITIGVVVHEIPQGITSVTIMRNAGYKKKRAYATLLLAGLLYPIGAALSVFIPPAFNQPMLALIAGSFLYIGASDLLPEAHKKFNVFVILSVLLGVAFVLLLKLVFPMI